MKYIFVQSEGSRYKLTRDLTWDEYYEVLTTGKLDGDHICAIEQPGQFEDFKEDKDKPKEILLFDFTLQRNGCCPWRYAAPAAKELRKER